MDLVTIVLIAIGLAMDAFAVSVARGMCAPGERLKTALFLGALFGGFQMLMPIIGWAIGLSISGLVMSIGYWIAFGLLIFIGAKMVHDAVKKVGEEDSKDLTLLGALMLAIATSLDALMVGLSFALLQTPILMPLLIIGAVTFTLCFLGFIFGCRLGAVFGEGIKIVGGVILMLIGIEILAGHLLG